MLLGAQSPRTRAGSGYASPVNSNVPARETAPTDDALPPAFAVYDLLSSLIRLMPRDISLTSLSTLATLHRKGPRRITELAVSEGIAQPSVTSLVTSLERAGLAERRGDPADGRVVLVAITETGAEYLRARRQDSVQVLAGAMARLSPEQEAALLAFVPVIEQLRMLLELEGRA